MCGIAGICHHDGRPIDVEPLRAMSHALAHRGPDDDGAFVCDGIPSVGLAIRRLAVIDIDGGRQPMSIDDGALTTVYNGELWNAPELRRELRSRGRRFKTQCDTEVLLHAYAVWGPTCSSASTECGHSRSGTRTGGGCSSLATGWASNRSCTHLSQKGSASPPRSRRSRVQASCSAVSTPQCSLTTCRSSRFPSAHLIEGVGGSRPGTRS